MYTLQSLWTQAREGLDVTTIIFSNHVRDPSAGAVTGGRGRGRPASGGVLDISTPPIDFAALARGMGVPATKPADAAALVEDLRSQPPSPART